MPARLTRDELEETLLAQGVRHDLDERIFVPADAGHTVDVVAAGQYVTVRRIDVDDYELRFREFTTVPGVIVRVADY